MDVTLFKSIAASVPIGMMLVGSIVMCRRAANLPSIMQLAGAACLMTVVATHMCEALRLFPWMGWGDDRSMGHYVNLGSAVLGLTLFPAGYLIYALQRGQWANHWSEKIQGLSRGRTERWWRRSQRIVMSARKPKH